MPEQPPAGRANKDGFKGQYPRDEDGKVVGRAEPHPPSPHHEA